MSEPADDRPADDRHLASMKAQVYTDERPPEAIQKYYDWPLTHKPDWVYTVVRVLTTTYVVLVHRLTCIDRGRIPTGGPAIFAPNHASNVDHFFVGAYTGRTVQFMAKSQLYKGWFAWVMKHGGVFPVRRGKADEQSFEVARSILARGGTICTYCEGGRSRSGHLADKAKPAGQRVVSVEIGGKPLDPKATYKLATNADSSAARPRASSAFPRPT